MITQHDLNRIHDNALDIKILLLEIERKAYTQRSIISEIASVYRLNETIRKLSTCLDDSA